MTRARSESPIGKLRRQLAEAKQTIAALTAGEIDALADSAGTTPILLAAAQNELQGSRSLLKAVFDGAMDGMILFDQRSRYVEVNAAACELFGRPREAMIGHKTSDFCDASFDVAATRKRLRALGQLRGELVVRRPDGDTRMVEFSAKTNIAPGLGLAIFRDVTDRKLAEQTLQQTEDKLRQAQRVEAIGRLAGGIAHDFNNLLCVILSYTALAIDSLGKDHPVAQDLAEVQNAGRRSADLTRQLLAFSRQQVLQPKVLVLNDLVRGMERIVRKLLSEEIELTLMLSAPGAHVEIDPGQAEQVILNLAANARDAMPHGGRLTIATEAFRLGKGEKHGDIGPGRYVVLSVTDTGVGMDAGVRARIFEPFFTTKEPGKGTGIGLATVLGIVQQFRGYVEVASKVGKGTTFKVYLPRTDQAERPAGSMAPPPMTLRGTETVLVVDDDVQVRGALTKVLRQSGYDVLEAVNGGDAVLLCEQHRGPIDLMVTDVVMPRLSGRQLADRVRPLRPEMRVLYTSGYTDSAIAHHGVLDPGIAYLQKPMLPDALLRKVREVLGPAKSRDSSAVAEL